eukprot:5646709-Karenia_brevis.AAC.1
MEISCMVFYLGINKVAQQASPAHPVAEAATPPTPAAGAATPPMPAYRFIFPQGAEYTDPNLTCMPQGCIERYKALVMRKGLVEPVPRITVLPYLHGPRPWRQQ